MAEPLITRAELGIWCRVGPTGIADDDDYATAVIDKASELVREKAEKTDVEWDIDTAPSRARTICLVIAERVYDNPQYRTAFGIAGGPSSRYSDLWAAGLTLTAEESAEIRKLAGLAAEGLGAGGAFWIIDPIDDQPYQTTTYFPALEPEADWYPMINNETDGYALP